MATKITLLVLLADVLTIFISSRILIGTHHHSFHLLDLSQQSAAYIQHIATTVRQLEFGARQTGPLNITDPVQYVKDAKEIVVGNVDYIHSLVDNTLVRDMSDSDVKSK